MRVGVLALQGAFREHILHLEAQGASTVAVRLPNQLDGLQGLVIPGDSGAYYTIQFDRFPVSQIERIEIIKGPGSVIYGGVGEVAEEPVGLEHRPGRDRRHAVAEAGPGRLRRGRGGGTGRGELRGPGPAWGPGRVD